MTGPEFASPRSPKIRDRHLAKLAVVYVRQSTPYQVLEHRESRERQYALVDHAARLGWPADRVLLIDDDQGRSGQSATDRPGFQRLLTEVTLGHVGLVLGLEASRLARSHRDWHQLFELCAVFDTLLADEEGVYDPADPNDRLLLGLKGMMSEVELLTMRNRLDRGKLHKAQRGELFVGVPPLGYVRSLAGTWDLDPDEQVQGVVRLLFAQFEALGSAWAVFRYLLRHGIRVGLRVRSGPARGQLEWRPLSVSGVCHLLRNPVYAGAYTYGRRDERRRGSAAAGGPGRWRPLAEWKVLLRDRLPAYITWEQYLANQEQLRRNRSGTAGSGVPRGGAALLSGLVVCDHCGHHLRTSYQDAGHAYYACAHHLLTGATPTGHSIAAAPVDELVAAEVLRAVEPAALELSLTAVTEVRRERERLTRHWEQRLTRARQEVARAERQYQAVEPEDRLVARTLERRWEAALQAEARLQEEYDRFRQEQAPPLSAAEQARIRQLATDLPALWATAGVADRKAVIRCLVERVVIVVTPETERATVTIHWQGGATGTHPVVRPVARYTQLADYERLLSRLRELRGAGHSAAAIAERLNAEGFHAPRQARQFDGEAVRYLLGQLGLGNAKACAGPLGTGEWWLADLARVLGLTAGKLRDWVVRGWLHARQGVVQGVWIVWADRDELRRLRRLQACSKRGEKSYPNELITPKRRRPE